MPPRGPQLLIDHLRDEITWLDVKWRAFRSLFGWRVGPIHGVRAVHHGGMLPDYRGKMVMLPDSRWGIVLLTNISTPLGTATSHRVADGIVAMLTGASAPDGGRPAGEWTLARLYLAIAVGAALLSASQLWQILTVRRRVKRVAARRDAASRRERFRAAFELAMPVAVLAGLPVVWIPSPSCSDKPLISLVGRHLLRCSAAAGSG